MNKVAIYKEEMYEKVASAWKRNFGHLSEEAVNKLKDSHILDHEKELSGLIKGSDNIAKKEGVVVKDFKPGEVKSDVKQEFKDKRFGVIARNAITRSQVNNTKFTNGNITFHHSKGTNIYKGDFAGSKTMKMINPELAHLNQGSLEHRYTNALAFRHELDEARASRHLSHSLPNHDTNIPNYHSHVAPSVITRESANVAIAPDKVKNVMKKIRGRGPERITYSKLTNKEYGKDADINISKMRKIDDKYVREHGYSKEQMRKANGMAALVTRAADKAAVGTAGTVIGAKALGKIIEHNKAKKEALNIGKILTQNKTKKQTISLGKKIGIGTAGAMGFGATAYTTKKKQKTASELVEEIIKSAIE